MSPGNGFGRHEPVVWVVVLHILTLRYRRTRRSLIHVFSTLAAVHDAVGTRIPCLSSLAPCRQVSTRANAWRTCVSMTCISNEHGTTAPSKAVGWKTSELRLCSIQVLWPSNLCATRHKSAMRKTVSNWVSQLARIHRTPSPIVYEFETSLHRPSSPGAKFVR